MSDEPPASDWWLANDGRWYPPEQHPDYQHPLPPPPDQTPGPGWWKASDGCWYPPSTSPEAGESTAAGPTVIGDAGASAKRQAESIRRRAENWESGAEGEELTAAELNKLTAEHYVLHDLHVPGSSANIDHLVVGPTGVWLIDTKAYSAPLRYGDGTVWRGKYPIRNEVAAVAEYANAVSAVLRVPVVPVLCFVGNTVPPEATVLGSVRLVALEDLVGLLVGPSDVQVADVDSVARLARTLRAPTPTPQSTTTGSRRAAQPTEQPSGKPRTAPTRTSQQRSPSAKKKTKTSSPLLGMVVVVGGLVAACVALNGASKAISNSTTTIAPPPLDGQMIEVATPNVPISAICATTGEAWQVGFGWPLVVDSQHEPVAYEVVSLTPEVVVEPKLWLGKNGIPEPITGIAPNTRVIIAAQGILADGTRLTPTTRERVVPDRPC